MNPELKKHFQTILKRYKNDSEPPEHVTIIRELLELGEEV